MSRMGPKTEVTYSCRGCCWLIHKDGHCGRRYLCKQPGVVEEYGEPQHTCTSNARTPDYLCPYLDKGHG